jgi:hypothetical protein
MASKLIVQFLQNGFASGTFSQSGLQELHSYGASYAENVPIINHRDYLLPARTAGPEAVQQQRESADAVARRHEGA